MIKILIIKGRRRIRKEWKGMELLIEIMEIQFYRIYRNNNDGYTQICLASGLSK